MSWDALQVVGISHRDAALAVRELFALAPEAVAALLERERAAGRTAVVLATCNRCELYWHGDHDAEPWLRELGAARGVADVPLVHRRGLDAMRHLFRVASGVESQILGETEILGQVRRAYDAARAAGTTDITLDLVFSAALTAGRRARHESILGRHPLSVSAAAVDTVRGEWGALDGKRIVVLGAGEVAEGVLQALAGSGAHVTVVNRHPERAEALASAWRAAAVREWAALPTLAIEADALLVATAAPAPTVTADLLAVASAGRGNRPLRVVDLAVPRNVEPAARALPGIELSDLDDLRADRCPVPDDGAAPVLPDVERVLDDELDRLLTALRGRAAAPRLAELHRESARVTDEEVERALSRLAHLGDTEREVVREMAERLVRRVLYPVSRELRRE